MKRIVRAGLTETKSVASLPQNPNVLTPRCVERVRRENLGHYIGLIRAAIEEGVEIICLNELFTAPYFALGKNREEGWLGFAESVEDGPTVRALCELTRDQLITILAPMYEQVSNGDRYNTTVIVESGQVIGKYRKTHIPHGENETGRFTEGFYYKKSEDEDQNQDYPRAGGHPLLPVFETRVGKVGVATCFDRHFSNVWEGLKEGGAELVFSPAVTFGATSRRMWDCEFPVEAVRNDFYIGGSNKKGVEFPGGPSYFGDSHFISPEEGQRLPNISRHPNLVVANLDLSLIGTDSSGWGLRENRRPELATK